MADERREIQFDFIANTSDLVKGSEEVALGMEKASREMSLGEEVMASLGKSAKVAAANAALMAADWALAGVEVATSANKIATNFERVFGSADALNHEVEELAGHMGLAEHEAQALLASAGMLGQSMGMSADESARFAAEMFNMAGDLARFNPEAGTAAEAMEALTAASNGSTKGLKAWDISIKNAEVNAKALAMTGKENTAALTQQEKAMATNALVMEKMGQAQGQLNRDIEAGNTQTQQARADIDDMQVSVGNALMPIKKLALEGLIVVAEVLKELNPLFVEVGKLLGDLLVIIRPVLQVLGFLASTIAKVISIGSQFIGRFLKPVTDWLGKLTSKLQGVEKWFKKVGNALPSWMGGGGQGFSAFHSGGTVPGARGTLTPIMAQGGERVVPPGQSARGGGDGGGAQTIVNITVTAGVSSPMDTARTIADLLTEYTAAQGPIPIRVRENA